MQRTPWLNVLVILLVIIAGFYLAQLLLQFLSGFSDIILLFVLAWLFAFALGPLVDGFNGKPLPQRISEFATKRFGPRLGYRVSSFRMTRAVSVTIVYIGFALVLVALISQLVPPLLTQLNQLAIQFPDMANRAPEFARAGQDLLSRFGVRVDVEAALLGAFGSLQNLATPALQNAVVLLTSLVGLVGNLVLVLILSFFFALDGPRLFRAIFDLVPESFDDEVRMLAITVDRAFGGFIRAQLLQAVMIGIGTAIVMALFGTQFVLVSSLFAALFMLIPFVGPLLALVPPIIVTLIAQPHALPLAIGILLIYQLIIANVIMPKLLSEALGLHPLVIIASLLIGIKVGGFWGAFFGVPVAGVIATMGLFFYRRWARHHDLLNDASDPEIASASLPAAPNPTTSPPARDLEKRSA